jgi:hypothetical protein
MASASRKLAGNTLVAVYERLIVQPVSRWYIRPMMALLPKLTPDERQAVQRQAVIGWLQTALLMIVLFQVIFAGLLRALPPDLRTALAFLHRIEWGAYLGIVLICAQIGVGWPSATVLTNRVGLLAWRFSVPQVVTGRRARLLQIAYAVLALILLGLALWVRAHGFIVTR